jgi:hypothetical protein
VGAAQSLVSAMIAPASTNSTITTCIHNQNGDTGAAG